MFRYYGFLGLISILSAYLLSFSNAIPHLSINKSLNNFLLLAGLWLFFDAIDFKLNKTSLLHKIKSKAKIVLYLILIGVLTGLFVEYFGASVSNLWGDRFYNALGKKPFYEVVLIFLSKVIAISYVLLLPAVYSIYHVFNHIFGKLKFKHDFKKKEKAIFYYLGLLGIIFIIIPIPLVMFLDLLPLVRSLLFGLPLLGLWFILEYVEHSQHKRSLLMDLLEFREGKLIAIVITSLLLGLLIEGLNNIAPAWSYKNIPFASVGIFGIPIIILLGWIPLIVIFLSFYRVFIKENDHIF